MEIAVEEILKCISISLPSAECNILPKNLKQIIAIKTKSRKQVVSKNFRVIKESAAQKNRVA